MTPRVNQHVNSASVLQLVLAVLCLDQDALINARKGYRGIPEKLAHRTNPLSLMDLLPNGEPIMSILYYSSRASRGFRDFSTHWNSV